MARNRAWMSCVVSAGGTAEENESRSHDRLRVMAAGCGRGWRRDCATQQHHSITRRSANDHRRVASRCDLCVFCDPFHLLRYHPIMVEFSESLGWIAAICGALSLGSFGVPVKYVSKQIQVNPLVLQVSHTNNLHFYLFVVVIM
jgi:hypothetical protein